MDELKQWLDSNHNLHEFWYSVAALLLIHCSFFSVELNVLGPTLFLICLLYGYDDFSWTEPLTWFFLHKLLLLSASWSSYLSEAPVHLVVSRDPQLYAVLSLSLSIYLSLSLFVLSLSLSLCRSILSLSIYNLPHIYIYIRIYVYIYVYMCVYIPHQNNNTLEIKHWTLFRSSRKLACYHQLLGAIVNNNVQ